MHYLVQRYWPYNDNTLKITLTTKPIKTTTTDLNHSINNRAFVHDPTP